MIRHAAGCVAAVVLILAGTLLPFLPGSYDPTAAAVSMTTRAFGWIGLLLVPLGAIWMARPRRATRLAALAGCAIVWALLSLAALSVSGFVLAAIVMLLGGYLLASLKGALTTAEPAVGLYLVAVPLVVFGLQQALIGRAVEFSRDRAIRNAAPLIADIERYRTARGVYPPSLLSVWPDYKPGVIGIERYRYEPSGEAYNVVFEQPARDLPTREFVVYNPRDEQVFTSHAMDLLQYSPEGLQRTRGYFAVHATAHPHWKYFWFD